MEKYKLIGIKERKNKEGKAYFLAYIILESQNNYDLLNVLINEKQVQPLLNVIDDNTFDIGQYLTIEYNSYQRSYNPVISYGL